MTEETAIQKFMSNPHKLVEYIKETGDFEEGFRYVSVVADVVSKFDATLDIVLKGMEELWRPEEHEGRSFYEEAVRQTPLSPTTIQRHTRVGKMLETIPESIRPRVESMDFKSKIYITHMVERGVEPTDEQWGRIVEQPSYQGVAAQIHEVGGTTPRSQWCHFQVDDDGVVWAHTSKGTFRFLEPVEYENEEVAELMDWVHHKAIRKLGATPK